MAEVSVRQRNHCKPRDIQPDTLNHIVSQMAL